MKSILIFIITTLFFSGLTFSQSDSPDMVTDRPDKTESASVVPAGWLQIETGAEFSRSVIGIGYVLSRTNIAATLLRYGVFDKLELRLGGILLVEQRNKSGVKTDISGLSDIMIGAKYNFSSDQPVVPDIALLIHLFLPAGKVEFKPPKTEPQAVLSVSKAVNNFLAVGINIGAQYNSSNKETDYFYTISTALGITERIGSFIELYSEVLPSSVPFTSLGAGFTYLLLPNIQLDCSGGNGLFHNSNVWYFGAGVSARIPR